MTEGHHPDRQTPEGTRTAEKKRPRRSLTFFNYFCTQVTSTSVQPSQVDQARARTPSDAVHAACLRLLSHRSNFTTGLAEPGGPRVRASTLCDAVNAACLLSAQSGSPPRQGDASGGRRASSPSITTTKRGLSYCCSLAHVENRRPLPDSSVRYQPTGITVCTPPWFHRSFIIAFHRASFAPSCWGHKFHLVSLESSCQS